MGQANPDRNFQDTLLERMRQLEDRVSSLETTCASLTVTVCALERQLIQERCNGLLDTAVRHLGAVHSSIVVPPPPQPGAPDMLGYHAAVQQQQLCRETATHIHITFSTLAGKLSNSDNPLRDARSWYSQIYEYLERRNLAGMFHHIGKEGFQLMLTGDEEDL